MSNVVPDTTDVDATPTADGTADVAVPTRQCGRCRGHFPIEEDVHPMELSDWWACPSCAESLLPGRRTSPPVEQHRGPT